MAFEVLERLAAVVPMVDVSGLTGEETASVLAEVRTAQRVLDGLVVILAERTRVLAENGRSASGRDVLRAGGVVGARQADREAARAEVAARAPGLMDRLVAGRTSGEHVDVVGRHLARLDDDQREAFDVEVLARKSEDMPVETFNRLVKRAVDAVQPDARLEELKAKVRRSEFRHWFDEGTGMGHFAGRLDPERYEKLTNAVQGRMAGIAARSEQRSVKMSPNLAAEALVELVCVDGAGGGSAARPSITVIVDYETVARGSHPGSLVQTEEGRDLPLQSVARLGCDAIVRTVRLDDRGVPLAVGRRRRTATDGQWAAIKAVHASCAWDRCDAPITWCQAHHVHEWEYGGPTDLANLVPLCSRHHHQVHEGGWRLKMLPDRSLRIHRPDGKLHADVPTPTRC